MGRVRYLLGVLPAVACASGEEAAPPESFDTYLRVDGVEYATVAEAEAALVDGSVMELCGEHMSALYVDGVAGGIRALEIRGCDRDHAVLLGDGASPVIRVVEAELKISHVTVTGGTDVYEDFTCGNVDPPEDHGDDGTPDGDPRTCSFKWPGSVGVYNGNLVVDDCEIIQPKTWYGPVALKVASTEDIEGSDEPTWLSLLVGESQVTVSGVENYFGTHAYAFVLAAPAGDLALDQVKVSTPDVPPEGYNTLVSSRVYSNDTHLLLDGIVDLACDVETLNCE